MNDFEALVDVAYDDYKDSLCRVHYDADEGRTLSVCCLDCRTEGATLGMARPVRPYVVAFCCSECGEELVAFDQFSEVAA